MPEIPHAFCLHKSLGRIRLKIPSKKGDVTYFNALKDELSKCNLVKKIEANPLTSSVLFIYSGDFMEIKEAAEAKNIFRLNSSNPNPRNVYQAISSSFKKIDSRIKYFTGDGLDIGAIAFLSLFGAGIYQISRGNFTAPAWYTAFWYALNIFLKSLPNKGFE